MAASQLEKSRRVQVQISAAMHRKLARAAKDSGISKSAYLRVALEREFTHQEKLEREIAMYKTTVPQGN
jgi:predicted HicB family RNase H-like nuclease